MRFNLAIIFPFATVPVLETSTIAASISSAFESTGASSGDPSGSSVGGSLTPAEESSATGSVEATPVAIPRAVDPELVGVDFESTARISDALARLRVERVPLLLGSDCPPANIQLEGSRAVIQVPAFARFRGRGSLIWVGDSEGQSWAVKVIRRRGAVIEDALLREKAVLAELNGLGGDSTLYYPVVRGSVPESCSQGMLVTEFVPGLTLKGAAEQLVPLSEADLALIAAAAIRVLRKVHSHGIVHGDIHSDNLVLSEGPSGGVRIIDFGRAAAYVDPLTLKHVPYVHNPHPPMATVDLLSPFELEGSPLSRRDDMYRLSETLYRVMGKYRLSSEAETPELARLKRAMRCDGLGTDVFTEFHHAMVALAFSERPDYEGWIRRFEIVGAAQASGSTGAAKGVQLPSAIAVASGISADVGVIVAQPSFASPPPSTVPVISAATNPDSVLAPAPIPSGDHQQVTSGAAASVTDVVLPVVTEFIGELKAADYDHIVVIPDVHGDLEMFVRTLWLALIKIDNPAHLIPESDLLALLQGAQSDKWSIPLSSNKRVAVVQLGDLMDRGPKSIECFGVMQEIEWVFGWKTVALFGNHEILNMVGMAGQFRHRQDLGGFPSVSERVQAVHPGEPIHAAMIALQIGMVRLAGIPDDDGRHTSTLFVHGGIDLAWLTRHDLHSEGVSGSALVHRVNQYLRTAVLTYPSARGLAAEEKSPIWTRQLAGDDEHNMFIGCGQDPDDPAGPLNMLLTLFDVSRIVVGHTPQLDNEFKQRCGGKIILADIAMSRWIGCGAYGGTMLAGFPAALFMAMDPTHRLESITPYVIFPDTSDAPVKLDIVNIGQNGAYDETCTFDDLRQIGSAPIRNLLQALYPNPSDADFTQAFDAIDGMTRVSRTCLKQLMAARVPPVGECSWRTSDQTKRAMCVAKAPARRAALSHSAKNGMCAKIGDRLQLIELDLDHLAEIGAREPNLPFLNIAGRQVSVGCRGCLEEWTRADHCAPLCRVDSAKCDDCQRLDDFAGTAHCMVDRSTLTRIPGMEDSAGRLEGGRAGDHTLGGRIRNWISYWR